MGRCCFRSVPIASDARSPESERPYTIFPLRRPSRTIRSGQPAATTPSPADAAIANGIKGKSTLPHE